MRVSPVLTARRKFFRRDHMVGLACRAVVLLLLLVLHHPSAAQERTKLNLGASSKTLGYSPLWVGAKRGFFEQQGLDVQLILLRGVPMTLQALAAGSLQIGSGGPEPYIEATERGLDFAIAGGIINGMAQVIIAGKNYKTIEDLRGGTIGASSLTSATVTALKEALRQKGLEYPRDYKLLIVAGGSASNLTSVAIRPDHRDHRRRATQSRRRRIGIQYPRALARRRAQLPSREPGHPPLLGREKPPRDGALHESDGTLAPLAARQPRRRRRIYRQGDAAQTRPHAQRLGILHPAPHVAPGRRAEHRRDETQPARLRRTERRQRTSRRRAKISRTQLSFRSVGGTRQTLAGSFALTFAAACGSSRHRFDLSMEKCLSRLS